MNSLDKRYFVPIATREKKVLHMWLDLNNEWKMLLITFEMEYAELTGKILHRKWQLISYAVFIECV